MTPAERPPAWGWSDRVLWVVPDGARVLLIDGASGTLASDLAVAVVTGGCFRHRQARQAPVVWLGPDHIAPWHVRRSLGRYVERAVNPADGPGAAARWLHRILGDDPRLRPGLVVVDGLAELDRPWEFNRRVVEPVAARLDQLDPRPALVVSVRRLDGAAPIGEMDLRRWATRSWSFYADPPARGRLDSGDGLRLQFRPDRPPGPKGRP